MAFKPTRYDSGKVASLLTASSTTIAKGDALDFSSGYVQRATSGSTNIEYVAAEDMVTASAAHKAILCIKTKGVDFIGDTAGSSSQALVGTFIDLTDHDTLNQAASSTNVFFVENMVGATTDKQVIGHFVENVA